MKSCKFSQIKYDYHLKNKNSLQKRLYKKYHLNIVQTKSKKSQSCSLNYA